MGWGLRLNKKAKVIWVTNIHLSLFPDCGCHVSVCLLFWSPCLLCHEGMGCIYKPETKPFFLKLFLPVYFSQQWVKYMWTMPSEERKGIGFMSLPVPITLWWDQALPCRWKYPPLLAAFSSFWNLSSIVSSLILLAAFQADVPNRFILLSCFPFTPWSRKPIMVETTLHL